MHIRNVLTREWARGETPTWKSPPFFLKLAQKINFSAHSYDDRKRSPWYNGFEHLGHEGPQSRLGLFPNARAISEQESLILDEFPKLDIEALNRTIEVKEPPYLECEDPLCIEQGFRHWEKTLFDGVRLLDCPASNTSMGTYSFYAPTKWCETKRVFGKIRLIINDRPRNTLFNPTTEHIELTSHVKLREIISYCLNRKYDKTWKATKAAIQASLRAERLRKQNLRATWSDFTPLPITCPIDPLGFVPALGKTDLSNAYYQLPVGRYWLNKVFIPSPGRWIPKLSAVLTFGNRKSVSAFQGWTEFVCRVALFYLGIPVVGYLDDYIIISPGPLGPLYHAAIVRLFALFGFTVTLKPSGSFPAKVGTPADILGLDYLTSDEGVRVSASPERITKIRREIAEFSSKLTLKSPLAENALQKIYGQISFVTTHRTFSTEGPLLALINPSLQSDPNEWDADKRAQVVFFLGQVSQRLQQNVCTLTCRLSTAAPTWYIYSDAMATRKCFGLAWVLHTPLYAIYWSWRSQRSDLGARLQNLNIFELEVLAALAAFLMLPTYTEGKPCNIHLKVDNVGAAHAIPRGGSSKSPAVCVFIDKLIQMCEKFSIRIIVTYIASKRNVSDEPSRLGTLKDSVPSDLKISDCTESLEPHLALLAPSVLDYDRRSAFLRQRKDPACSGLQKVVAPGTARCPLSHAGVAIRASAGTVDRSNAKQAMADLHSVFRRASAAAAGRHQCARGVRKD